MGSQIYWWWSRSQKVIFEICFCVKGVVVVGRGRGGGGWAFVCFWLLRRIRRKIKPLKLSLYGCFHFCLQSVFVYQNWRILWLGHFILQLFGVKALVRACSWKDSWLDGLGGGGGYVFVGVAEYLCSPFSLHFENLSKNVLSAVIKKWWYLQEQFVMFEIVLSLFFFFPDLFAWAYRYFFYIELRILLWLPGFDL